MKRRPPGEIGRHKVLVVDDNDAARYSTSRVLRNEGFEVLEVASGEEALASATPDVGLIVLDVNLPDIDGFEVCRQLRSRSHSAHLPVVHLSAMHTEQADIARGLAAGADSYLMHPVEPAVLIATVKALLFARQADVLRRATDARFRTVFELTSGGIVLLDADLVFLDVNPAFCKLTGHPRESLVGESVRTLLAGDPKHNLQSMLAELERTDHWHGTMPIRRGDGTLAEIEWHIEQEAGSGALIALAHDITERLRIEDERERLLGSERAARSEAERNNHLRDEFLATLSHELRNPLNAIVGWASALRRAPGDADVVRKGLEAIERNSRVQAHLIGDLLDFASISFGKMRFEPAVIDPSLTLQGALEVVAAQAEEKRVHVTSTIADRDARILGDESRLQQITWNLLSNAIKFTPAGGCVKLSGRADGEHYEITVRDNGRGIAPEFLPRIFDRFSQQESGTRKSYAGLGIGLSIVKHMVDMHRGEIRVTSEGEGRGATFAVRLPLVHETGPRSADELQEISLAGAGVLIVDDDPDARALIARILADAGATVADVASADEAIDWLTRRSADVLISDIGMARKDGYQLLQELRAGNWPESRLPAVAVTAFARSEDRHDALNAGFQAHVVKPVDAGALVAAVARLRR